MKLSVLTLLLCAALPTACLAADASACKSFCAAEKRECRAQSVKATLGDSDPMLVNEERNRDARTMAKLEGSTAASRSRAKSDFQKRKMERDQTCDDTQLRCSRACSADSEPASSVLVKPSAKH